MKSVWQYHRPCLMHLVNSPYYHETEHPYFTGVYGSVTVSTDDKTDLVKINKRERSSGCLPGERG